MEKLKLDFNQLTEMDIEKIGSVELKPEKIDFIKEFCLSSNIDYSNAKDEFGYALKYTLEQMIKESLNYFVEKNTRDLPLSSAEEWGMASRAFFNRDAACFSPF